MQCHNLHSTSPLNASWIWVRTLSEAQLALSITVVARPCCSTNSRSIASYSPIGRYSYMPANWACESCSVDLGSIYIWYVMVNQYIWKVIIQTYISREQNYHDFLSSVHVLANTLNSSSSASLYRLALLTATRNQMRNWNTKNLCWSLSREPWDLWLIGHNRKQQCWKRMGLTSCCNSLCVEFGLRWVGLGNLVEVQWDFVKYKLNF